MSVRSLNDTEWDREGVLQIWRICAKITCGLLAADQKQQKSNFGFMLHILCSNITAHSIDIAVYSAYNIYKNSNVLGVGAP